MVLILLSCQPAGNEPEHTGFCLTLFRVGIAPANHFSQFLKNINVLIQFFPFVDLVLSHVVSGSVV